MADYGVTEADKAVRGLEKRLRKVYEEAERDIDAKMADFWKRYEAKEAIHRKELEDGKITQAQYDAWVKGQVFQGRQWKAKKEQIQSTLYNANTVATKMINGQMANVFAVNANYMAYSLEHDANANFGFGIYDSATVANLIQNDPQLLPKWKINEKKDYVWNGKKVVSQITQGIIQGERLDQIGKRLSENLCSTNKNKMMTFARTAMTGAQNAGRQFSLTEAKNKGINVEKEWMATLDGRTRDTHRELDGQKVPMDKPFKVDGDEIMFPGDPTAKARLVFNCRCTMVGDLVDYPSEYKRYDNIDGKPIKNMTYREWEKAKTKQRKKGPTLYGLVKPKRPSRDDFINNEDGLEIAREAYRQQRKAYEEQVQQFIDESMPEAMSMEEFERWCETNDVKIYGDVSPVDRRALTAYTQRMDKLFKDFPEVKDYRKKFDIPEEFQHYEFGFDDTMHYIAEASHGFTFGSSGKDMAYLLSEQADAVGDGYRVIGDGTINQLFDHEFGHNVFDWLSHREDQSEGNFQRRLKMERDLVQSVAGKSGASEYSNTNADELFAEAFSAWYGGEDTEFARAMGDFLRRWGVV